MITGSVIIPTTAVNGYNEYTGDYSKIIADTDFKGIYNLCIAGDENIPVLTTSAFVDEHILQQTIDSTVKRVQQSKSYRIGNFIIYPLSIIKRFISNFL
jgi:hypothetical protein